MSASLRRPMNVLVMTSLLTLLFFVGAAAQGAEEALPRDILAKEFTYSLTGAYVGGLFGYVLSIYLYNLKLLPCGKDWGIVGGSRCEWPPLIGSTIGSSLGSTLLLSLGSARLGVRGRIVGALVGATLGAFGGMLIADSENVAPWFPILTVLIVGTPAGLLAVPLYNLGATMEVKLLSVSPSGLELVSTRLQW